jgi:lipopolysaccharide/colanic/teichoic acid biosynthesis glycosyltransferase
VSANTRRKSRFHLSRILPRVERAPGVDAHAAGPHELEPGPLFRARLLAERKRTERTSRPFILALIDVSRLESPPDVAPLEDARQVLGELSHLLHEHTREIDVKGWFDDAGIIGVLYPEALPEHRDDLERRLHTILHKALGSDFKTRVGVRWLEFPDQHVPWAGMSGADGAAFYGGPANEPADQTRQAVKRVIDASGSACAIVALSPLLLLIAALVKLTSRGPVLFRQERVGAGGKPFVFLKFRSMYVDCDQQLHRDYVSKFIRGEIDGDNQGHKGVFKLTNDPRVTPLGRILRKTSLDELPQFFNVLRGEMSLVGPRPAIPYELDQYDLWHRRRILEVKPGITGAWQVAGRSATTFDGMVRMDIHYSQTWSLWNDIKLMAETPKVLVTGRGAQ